MMDADRTAAESRFIDEHGSGRRDAARGAGDVSP